MAALAKLKVKSNDLFLQLQEIYDSAKEFDENQITDRQFRLKLNLLQSIQKQFEKIHEDCLNKLVEDPEALEEHQNIAKMFRNLIFNIQCYALKLPEIEADSKTSQIQNDAINSKPSSKLPELKLPKFDGNLTEWMSFEQRFNANMDEHRHLKNVQRLQYLLSCLSAEALNLIKHLPIEDCQYLTAWSILKTRYFNRRIIIENYFSRLLDAPLVNNHNYEQLNSLYNTANENIQALTAMKIPLSDPLIITILSRKLDKKTRHDWEIHIFNNDEPTINDWLHFLSIEVSALRINQLEGNSSSKVKLSTPKKVNTFITQPNTYANCEYCKRTHPLYKCYKFKALSESKRIEFVKKYQICSNCLHGKHQTSSCPSNRTCMVCGERHHSLLHPSQPKPQPVENSHLTKIETTDTNQSIAPSNSSSVHLSINEKKYVLMATALADIVTENGRLTVRLLLDSASQASYITTNCVQKFCLNKISMSSTVLGFGGTPVEKTEELVHINLCPVNSDHPSYTVSAHVTKRITTAQPSVQLTGKQFSHFSNLKLSDPNFKISHPIDMLIGSDLFPYILTGNKISRDISLPVALETTFGWVIMGNISQEFNTSVATLFAQNEVSLDKTIQKFWEVENISTNDKIQKAEDIYCEELFVKEVKRTTLGRYIVPLLLKPSHQQLGNSYNNALTSFYSLKRKFSIDPNLERDYSAFMKDYLDTGHMSLASPEEAEKNVGYYIPHLCVLRPESTTTRLRVVFNGSRKTNNGISLNDILFPGPTLQQNINSIVNNFRLHQFVLITDIKQMYRQIQVDPKYQHFQKILWSFNSAPETYVLRTVTYGLSCAPFLALRTIKQLALDEGKQFPLAAEALKNDTYVDDIITGANSIEDAISLQQQLRGICHSAGLELRKWCSNSSDILDGIPQEYRMINDHTLNLDNDPSTKILGLRWNPSSDNFFYQITSINSHCTKRSILSQLARIFDPQGWLTPVTMFLKILMQVLWTSKINWDDEPPQDIRLHWNSFISQINQLKTFVIPRIIPSNGRLDLCGFSDASERGYAAVIYCRSENIQGSISIALVMAKSRVAPLARISLARLELCGALLLAQLFKIVLPTYQNKITSLTACSDSTTTLAWIRSSPHRWSTFVANRITQIQEIIAPENWHYVSSKENPADSASRGLLPASFLSNNLWKTGPKWLYNSPSEWFTREPGINQDSINVERRKEKSLTFVTTREDNFYINKYSSFLKIQRITAYILRFIKRCRQEARYKSLVLSPDELKDASLTIIKIVQRSAFEQDIHLLLKKQLCSKPLRKLSPYLDDDNILRVGGRLKHAAILQTQKNPILLPQTHHVTMLIIRYEHQRHGHIGPTTLRSILLQHYWILSIRRAIRRCLSTCVICIRNAPVMLIPEMANLPTYRVQKVRPFQQCWYRFWRSIQNYSVTLQRCSFNKSIHLFIHLLECKSSTLRTCL